MGTSVLLESMLFTYVSGRLRGNFRQMTKHVASLWGWLGMRTERLQSIFYRTCFSMGDLGVQVSVRPFVRPFVFPSTFTLGVLGAQLLLQFCTDHFETLHMFSSWNEDVLVVWI